MPATVIDISNVNGAVDWNRIVKSGIQGAYIKLSEGVTFDDPDSYAHAKAARRAGIPYGYYHFAHPERNTPEDEAAHVVRRLARQKPDFRLVLDLEQGAPAPAYGDWAHRFSQALRPKLGHFPILYSYGPYVQGIRLAKPVGSGLWLASYGRNDGKEYPYLVPAPWKKVLMHQFSSECRVGGCEHPVDLSHVRSVTVLRAP